MLVLTRKNLESVVVGGSDGFERILKVTVLDIGSGKVRLGFEVDADIPVHRLEVWERIRATVTAKQAPAARAGPQVHNGATVASRPGDPRD